MFPLDDTIVAIASAPGGAARGIVRLSGPRMWACVEAIFRADEQAEPPSFDVPRVLSGTIRVPEAASPLQCDAYLWPGRRSYTGQPVAEFHTLGSRPLLEAVLHALCTAGARLAEPGEFTLRAFLAGRIDLTQAEAVLGVVDAADPHALDVALAQLAGGLAGPLHELRDDLVALLAHLEAGFDFADEDLPFITPDELGEQLAAARRTVANLAARMAARDERTQRIRAVLVGAPNTGKSSLFNTLAHDAGALVSEHPGTTRDYLTAELDFDGVKCQLIDTAGVEPMPVEPVVAGKPGDAGPAADPTALHSIEDFARAASAQQSRQAHVRIVCLDSTRPPQHRRPEEFAMDARGTSILVLTKIDARSDNTFVQSDASSDTQEAIPTSSVTGEGIDALRDAIRRAVLAAAASDVDVVAGTAARCYESLRLAGESLDRACRIATGRHGDELVAAEVRVALDELGKVVGAIYTDDVLDRIFSRFCIGK